MNNSSQPNSILGAYNYTKHKNVKSHCCNSSRGVKHLNVFRHPSVPKKTIKDDINYISFTWAIAPISCEVMKSITKCREGILHQNALYSWLSHLTFDQNKIHLFWNISTKVATRDSRINLSIGQRTRHWLLEFYPS